MKAHLIRIITQCLMVTVFGFGLGGGLLAQQFEKAPVAGVKKIIEWKQSSAFKGVKKGYTYHFNNKGNITNYEDLQHKELPEKGTYEYDRYGRLAKHKSNCGSDKTTIIYRYSKNAVIEVEKFRDSYYKTEYYYDNGGKLLEKKKFLANANTKDKYLLFTRDVYTYNSRDSLRGEVHYNYYAHLGRSRKTGVQTHKTLHHYYREGKRKRSDYIDFDGSLIYHIYYKYDERFRLVEKKLDFLNGRTEVITYSYKQNKLWTAVHSDKHLVVTSIFDKGRLVRERKKWTDGGGWEVTDFQYFFK